MEMFQIILLTVAASVLVTSDEIPKPQLTLKQTWKVFYLTERVTLMCKIQSSSVAWSYKWVKNGEPLPESTSQLEIKLETKEKQHYTCQGVFNDTMTTETSSVVTLEANEPPKPKLTVDPDWTEIFSSEKITLKCEFDGNSNGWSFELIKNGKSINPNPTLTITANPSHSGQYTCTAKLNGRSVNTHLSNALRLNVRTLPNAQVMSEWKDAFLGETVLLQCVIGDASENWIYEWFSNDTTVSRGPDTNISGNKLSLSVKTNHIGSCKYVCQVELGGRSVKSAKSAPHLLYFHGSQPEVFLKQDPDYSEIYTGEQVKLICGIQEQTSLWTYQWSVPKSVQDNSLNHIYTIPSTTLSHNGLYTCSISRGGVAVSKSKNLAIIEPPEPKLSIVSQWKEFYSNEKVTLNCSIKEKPDDWSYEWYKNEKKLSNDNEISLTVNLLVINSAKTSNSGSYKCRAKHLQRSSVTTRETKDVQLQINGFTPNPEIRKYPSLEFFYTAEQVQLTCNMLGVGWNYDWYKNSEHFSANANYTITSASLHHTGDYSCKATRGGFSIQSDTLKVQVKEPPQPKLSIESQWKTFYPNEKVTLKCLIDENPNDWRYNWYKNKTELSELSETLSIDSAQTHDSGSYKCKAKHLQRTAVDTSETEAMQIHIFDVTPKPDISKHPSFEFFYTDEQIRLDCKMAGVGWEYYWYKDSEPTQPYSANINYTITSASLHHTGDYSCKATRGGFSIQSDTLKVQVKEPPQPKLLIESQWKTFYPNEKVTLKCLIDENPNDWRYNWYKNKTELSELSETLSIDSAQTHDSGSYKCKAKHLQRTAVDTSETEAMQIHIFDATPKPDISKHPLFEFFYTDEQIRLDCNMMGVGWEYYWYKDSEPTQPYSANANYTINSASLHHTGEYNCKAKRGDFTIHSDTLKVQVEALSPTVLTLITQLSDIMAGTTLTLRCEVLDEKNEWNYTWFENQQQLNESSNTLKVTATEDTIKNEFKCKGIRTVRPLYSSWSEVFVANNIVFKRKIVLAITGCFICCIVILIIGGIALKITRKPERKETVREELFISLADPKNQATSPLMEYMDNKPPEKKSGEKEELQLDRISVTHVDGVINGEDSPAAESNGLTSFKN